MKRLVKTAKQQFEEAIVGYLLFSSYGDQEYYIHEKEGQAIIYCACDSEGHYQWKTYDSSWDEMCADDIFAESIICQRLDEGCDHITDVLHWWCNGHDKMKMPFSPASIFDSDYSERDYGTFEDIYEEVPDQKTASDKFDSRIIELGLWDEWNKQGCLGRIGIEVDNEIIIFVHMDYRDKYSEFHYPCFTELRKNDKFRLECLSEFSGCNSDFISKLVLWLSSESQECPLDPVDVYFPANFLMKVEKSFNFKDDQPEQSFEEMLKLTEKQKEAVRMIEEGVRMLYENDGKIFQNFDDNVYYAVNAKSLEFQTTNWEHEKMKNRGYSDVSFIVSKQKLDFCNDYWATDGSLFAKKSN